MSSTCSRICSSCAACPTTSAPTTSYVGKEGGGLANRSLFARVRSRHKGRQWRTRRLLPRGEELSAIANTGSSERCKRRGPHRPRDAGPGRSPEHFLQGGCRALTAHAERGSPTWHRPLKKGPADQEAGHRRVLRG